MGTNVPDDFSLLRPEHGLGDFGKRNWGARQLVDSAGADSNPVRPVPMLRSVLPGECARASVCHSRTLSQQPPSSRSGVLRDAVFILGRSARTPLGIHASLCGFEAL